MATCLELALSLLMGTYGPNGLDPTQLRMLQAAAGTYEVLDPATGQPGSEFMDWLRAKDVTDPSQRPQATKDRARSMYYFVRCAFPPSVQIKLGAWTWTGQYGLLGNVGGSIAPVPDLARYEQCGVSFQLDPEALAGPRGRRVSACLMAHVNVRGWHEFISLRGNPEDAATRKLVCPTDAERWVMGQPEGVFFADLFREPRKAPRARCTSPSPETSALNLMSYTASLNLPGAAPPSPRWRPPNPVVARSLDYDPRTLDDGCVQLALLLGTRHSNASSFEPAVAAPSASPDCTLGDPDYPWRSVCIEEPAPDARTRLASCSSNAAVRWEPLFVHMPRVANFESATPRDPGPNPIPFRVIAKPPLETAQIERCPKDCIGPHPYLRAGATPPDLSNAAPGGKVVGLKAGQYLEAKLSFVPAAEAAGVKPPGARDAFAAIIRYRCRDSAGCRANVMAPEQRFTSPVWPSTGDEYRWAVAYPIFPSPTEKLTLAVRIEGGPDAPELDAVGFLPGSPASRCAGQLMAVAGAEREEVWREGRDKLAPLWGYCKPWIETVPASWTTGK